MKSRHPSICEHLWTTPEKAPFSAVHEAVRAAYAPHLVNWVRWTRQCMLCHEHHTGMWPPGEVPKSGEDVSWAEAALREDIREAGPRDVGPAD